MQRKYNHGRSWCRGPLILLFTAVLAACSQALSTAGETFAYVAETTNPGDAVRFEVTSEGLSSITVGDRQIASGGWQASDASWLYGHVVEGGQPPTGEIERLAENRVRVRQETPTMTATFVYTFDNEDVHIHARIENFGDTTFKAVGFHGLEFRFSAEPWGYFHTHGRGFVARMAQMNRLFHPCWWHKLGGSYVGDGDVGIGLSPLYRELTRTLFWWDNGRHLHYLVGEAIPPQGALAFAMTLRVSRSTDWRHLLAPYRAHFYQTFGPVRYRADHRPIGATTLASASHITDDNPYGWSWWRLDQAGGSGGSRGMTEFAEQTAETIRRADGQGIIAWVVTGWNPRGMNFRPDFDVMPPEVEEQLAIWRRVYQRNGLKMGALARPAEFPTPVAWGQDGRVWLSAEDPPMLHDAQTIPPIQIMINRFANMKQRGFTLYYLDVYGVTYSDAKSARHFRNELGPNVLTFTEFWSDVVLVNTGAYLHFRWNEEAGECRETWRREHLWEIIRWLIPGVQGMAPTGETAAVPPNGANAPGRFLYERGITPMFWQGTRSTAPIADELRLLVAEFLDDQGAWKEQ